MKKNTFLNFYFLKPNEKVEKINIAMIDIAMQLSVLSIL